MGFTLIALAFALWVMIFHPVAVVLLFSKRDDEAKRILLGRLIAMLEHLPPELRPEVQRSSAHEVKLANGSEAFAFPTSAGHGYTATVAIVDEADKMGTANTDDLPALMNAVKPTVDAGGKLFLISTPDKGRPQSLFKKIYRAAGETGYTPLFFGWRERQGRTDEWYENEKRGYLASEGTLDSLYQEYPATPEEAMAPRSLDKRLPSAWLTACYRTAPPLAAADLLLEHLSAPAAPSLPGLTVFVKPDPRLHYVIGADPAEGNPTSDESAAVVLDEGTGEQVAVLAGRIEPTVFADYLYQLSEWYNSAPVLVERNNHGWAVIPWLRDNARGLFVLHGDDGRPGWQESSRTKALLYTGAATRLREGRCVIRDERTFCQLCSVEGATLKAPDGEHDDRAVAYCLALAAIDQVPRGRCDVWT